MHLAGPWPVREKYAARSERFVAAQDLSFSPVARAPCPGMLPRPEPAALQETDTDRFADFYRLVRGFQQSCCLIDAEDDYSIRVLVGDNAELTCRIDVEISRILNSGILEAERSQRSFFRIDCINSDRIVSAVRGVKELSAGMNPYFGAVACPRKTLREGGNGLNLGQPA